MHIHAFMQRRPQAKREDNEVRQVITFGHQFITFSVSVLSVTTPVTMRVTLICGRAM